MRLSRLGTDSSLPPDYQGFRAASELGRSILAAGQPSSCRPITDRGCKAAIQGAAPHRRIRRRDQGRAVGDESASRNRKFESTPLQRRAVRCFFINITCFPGYLRLPNCKYRQSHVNWFTLQIGDWLLSSESSQGCSHVSSNGTVWKWRWKRCLVSQKTSTFPRSNGCRRRSRRL